MQEAFGQILKSESKIFYDYSTIRITKGRIDKGLLAIPRSLDNWFPDHNTKIKVYLDDSLRSEIKNYSSYRSSTNESRIGGLSKWFERTGIKDEDEIVIQLLDKNNHIYRLIPERNFIVRTKELQTSFDLSLNEVEAFENLETLMKWTDSKRDNVTLSEYFRIVKESSSLERKYFDKSSSKVKEGVPSNLRILLRDIYQGHCQLCEFTFLKKNKTPYFEIHHLDPMIGNSPKNLVLVCANCHRQFEYAKVYQEFNPDGWLIKVSFNDNYYTVEQILLQQIHKFVKRTHIHDY